MHWLFKKSGNTCSYVDVTRSSTGFLAFENGLDNLQDALDIADLPEHSSKIVEIRMADGTYRPTDPIDPMSTNVDIGAIEGAHVICNYTGDQVRENSIYFFDQSLATRGGIWKHGERE